MTRRRYLAMMLVGMVVLVIGTAVLGVYGAADAPKPEWFDQANAADYIGGVVASAGIVLMMIGWAGRRDH